MEKQQYWIDIPGPIPERLFVRRYLRENEIIGIFDHWGLSVSALPEQMEQLAKDFCGKFPESGLHIYTSDGVLSHFSVFYF